MSHLQPVILSGGVGSRLWPLSREHYPKQLLNLAGDQTMLQSTALRLQGLAGVAPALVVCNEAHRFLVAAQLQHIAMSPRMILLEPSGRNTAPAVAVAAWQALEYSADAVLLVLPADHVIQQPERFRTAVHNGLATAQAGQLVTFGIVPNRAETGYGYIKAGTALTGGAYAVEQFVEKPSADIAAQYVASGHYFWNSGMFLFRADQYLAELQQWAPAVHHHSRAAFENGALDVDNDFLRLAQADFAACPAISIDYAVMEKTANAAVSPLDAGWNDIGAWTALWETSAHDAHGNALRGDVLALDSENCYLRSEYRLLAVAGLRDIIAVETADAVLVAHKNQAQQVKHLVERLKDEQRLEADLHRKVFRPWGTYENLDVEQRFKVKRIMVNPGASLSLQLHYHRSEHWIVVKGTAKITRGEESFILTENQSTYIPVGVAHRLENPGKLPLELIEVQSGAYLGEDDIVRLEDQYGRDCS